MGCCQSMDSPLEQTLLPGVGLCYYAGASSRGKWPSTGRRDHKVYGGKIKTSRFSPSTRQRHWMQDHGMLKRLRTKHRTLAEDTSTNIVMCNLCTLSRPLAQKVEDGISIELRIAYFPFSAQKHLLIAASTSIYTHLKLEKSRKPCK